MFRTVDAADALADLIAVSSQVEAAVIADNGHVLATTLPRGDDLAAAGRALLESAAGTRDGREPAQLGASTAEGGVFVVRDAGRMIVATTVPQPIPGLVFYDLKTCLRNAS